MNAKLPQSKFPRYAANYDAVFKKPKARKKKEPGPYETHMRRCKVCRYATNYKEACKEGKALIDAGEVR